MHCRHFGQATEVCANVCDAVVWVQTSTINCLTGVIPASGGDALVYGEALSSTGGMDRIRSMMGVCPQFDVLWSELTGLEHLTIYGNIKVPPPCPCAQGGSACTDS